MQIAYSSRVKIPKENHERLSTSEYGVLWIILIPVICVWGDYGQKTVFSNITFMILI